MNKYLVLLSYSQQLHNKCKVCDSEYDHCKKIAQEMYNTLISNKSLRVVLIPDYSEYQEGKEYINMAVEYSNGLYNQYKGQFTKMIHFCIHTDAYEEKQRGISTFYYSEEGKKLASIVHKNLVELNGLDRSMMRRIDLGELKRTKAIAVLVENDFHDNIAGATWIHNNIKKIAETHCKSILSYFQIPSEDLKNPSDIFKECTLDPEKWEAAKIYINEHLHELPDVLHIFKNIDLLALKCYYRNKTIPPK